MTRARPKLDRRDGHLIYGWKRDTSPIFQKEQSELIAKGLNEAR
jgi:hypothetical protein